MSTPTLAQQLTISPQADVADSTAGVSVEAEPNGRMELATPFDPANELSGELDVRDNDYFRFSLEDGAMVRDIGFVLEKDTRVDMCLFNAAGEKIKCSRGAQSIFKNMALSGEYVLSLSNVQVLASPVAYRMSFSAPRSPRPGHEVEPNDRWEDANELATGTTINGTLPEGDFDSFRKTSDRTDRATDGNHADTPGAVKPVVKRDRSELLCV